MSKRASYNTPQSGRSQSPPVNQSPPAKQSPAGKASVSPPKNNQPPAKSIQPPAKTQPAKSAPKETPKSVPKGSFDPSPWVKQGHPQELVIEIKNAFDLFDTDQGGSIDTKELKAAMVSLGFDSKNGSIFQMIADLDSDGNGNIDFAEFFSLMTTKVSDKNTRAQFAKVFAMFDDDKKGYITAENLVRVAETLGEQITIAEIGEMIKRADLDNDAVVSEEEFYAIMTKKL